MHSSRMRTGRSLIVCCSLLPGEGVSGPGGCLLWGGLVPGGCLLWGVGVSTQGGVCSQGVGGVCSGGSSPGGVSAPGGSGPGGLLLGGVCSRGSGPGVGLLQGGWCIPACTEADTLPLPLWTEFLTHACENITLAQLRCGR